LDRIFVQYLAWLAAGSGPDDNSSFLQRALLSGVVLGTLGLGGGLIWAMLWLDGAPDAPWTKRKAAAQARQELAQQEAMAELAMEFAQIEHEAALERAAKEAPAPTPIPTPAHQVGQAYQLSAPAALREDGQASRPLPAGAWVQVRKTHEAYEYVEARLADGTSLGVGWLVPAGE
jgi:hypothetical protein